MALEYKLPRRSLESDGAARLKKLMQSRGWTWNRITPGKYGTAGLPDVYATHPKWGYRWIETKAPKGKLRASQVKKFTEFALAGIDVFVCVNENWYKYLFGPPNWKRWK